MDKAVKLGARVLWSDLCRDRHYRGAWVALTAVRYDEGAPVEGVVVDSDTDLAALCTRIQTNGHTSCAILYCDDKSSGIRRAIS